MLLALSTILLVLSALFFCTLFKIRNKVTYLVSFYLVCYSLNVLTAEISGFMGLLASKLFFFLIQGIFLIVLVFLWWKNGKPSILGPYTGIDLKETFSRAWKFTKKNLLTVLFGLIVFAGYGVLAWLILNVPPNNSDSMHTHLARIMYWLQQGSFKQLNCFSIFARIYPFDNNLNMLWTILMTGTDKFVGFIQYFAGIFCAIAIFGMVRVLGGSKRTGVIISLLWMTFTENVFQATTPQNDLVITALFTICIFLFFQFVKTRNFEDLFFSGLALGLSFGTKETMFMMGLGILIMLALFILKDKGLRKPILHWILIGISSFLILGSFTFFNNLYYYHNPLGPSEHVFSDSLGATSIGDKFKYNTPRLMMQFFSFDSLPVNLADKGTALRGQIFSAIFSKIGVPLDSSIGLKDNESSETFSYNLVPSWNEDTGWYGTASFLMIIPAFLIGLILGIKKKDPRLLSVLFFCLTFYFFEVLLRPGWDPYQGRYFSMTTALVIPLSAYVINDKGISKVFTLFLYAISILTLFFAVTSNQTKPLLGTRMFDNAYKQLEIAPKPQSSIQLLGRKLEMKLYSALWYNLPYDRTIRDYDDIQLRTFGNRTDHEEIERDVEKFVPADAVMGVILGDGKFDYVFFGPKLERRLISINPIDLLYNETWIRKNHLQYVLISNQGRIHSIPNYLTEIVAPGDWMLFSVNSN
jgi:hypothetical protein